MCYACVCGSTHQTALITAHTWITKAAESFWRTSEGGAQSHVHSLAGAGAMALQVSGNILENTCMQPTDGPVVVPTPG